MENREIKFRAWDKEQKEMIYNGLEYQLRLLEKENNCEISEHIGYHAFDWQYFEIMQYTGLKDKEGNEVYEGDILGLVGRRTLAGIVEYCEGKGFCIKTWSPIYERYSYNGLKKYMFQKNAGPGLGQYEIIGNIYENPKLINK